MKRFVFAAIAIALCWSALTSKPEKTSSASVASRSISVKSVAARQPETHVQAVSTQPVAANLPSVDFAALHARFGTADSDTTTAYDNPRPRLVTRTMVFRKHRLKVVMLADAKAGIHPPYKRWSLMGLFDPETEAALSADEIQKRLNPPPPKPAPSSPEKTTTANTVLAAAAIAAILVRESRNAYYASGRSCACPDDVTRSGRRCGRNSAYSKPGGAQPLCYPQDVPSEMIDRYRKRSTAGLR